MIGEEPGIVSTRIVHHSNGLRIANESNGIDGVVVRWGPVENPRIRINDQIDQVCSLEDGRHVGAIEMDFSDGLILAIDPVDGMLKLIIGQSFDLLRLTNRNGDILKVAFRLLKEKSGDFILVAEQQKRIGCWNV